MVSVPAPRTSAPMVFRKFARSTTWGSLAAFSMTVTPRAFTAVSMMFMVAPTETTSKYICAPKRSFCAVTEIMPPLSRLCSQPRASKPFKCWSIGRTPKSQPPGSGTSACRHRPRSAPMK